MLNTSRLYALLFINPGWYSDYIVDIGVWACVIGKPSKTVCPELLISSGPCVVASKVRRIGNLELMWRSFASLDLWALSRGLLILQIAKVWRFVGPARCSPLSLRSPRSLVALLHQLAFLSSTMGSTLQPILTDSVVSHYWPRDQHCSPRCKASSTYYQSNCANKTHSPSSAAPSSSTAGHFWLNLQSLDSVLHTFLNWRSDLRDYLALEDAMVWPASSWQQCCSLTWICGGRWRALLFARSTVWSLFSSQLGQTVYLLPSMCFLNSCPRVATISFWRGFRPPWLVLLLAFGRLHFDSHPHYFVNAATAPSSRFWATASAQAHQQHHSSNSSTIS